MTKFDRVSVKLGRLSFACDADDLDRQLELHLRLARRAGWSGKPKIQQFRSKNLGRELAAQENRRQRARWGEVLSSAASVEDAARIAGTDRNAVYRAIVRYRIRPGWLPDSEDVGTLVEQWWREIFAAARMIEQAAALSGLSRDTCSQARRRFGLGEAEEGCE